MLIAEDLLLLLTDDATGGLTRSGPQVDLALAGAVLIELTARDRVDVSGEGDPGRPGRIVVRDPSPTGDALLDDALTRLRDREGDKPKDVLRALAKRLRERLYGQLVERGILRAERGRILGLFPTHGWPAEDGRHEEALRADLQAVLLNGADPDERTGAVIALLHAIRAVRAGVDAREHSRSRRDVDRRAKQVAEDDWGSAAVRKAVDEMATAVAVGVGVAITVAVT